LRKWYLETVIHEIVHGSGMREMDVDRDEGALMKVGGERFDNADARLSPATVRRFRVEGWK
jgi:hypothetical protein